jgi:TPR repeat protein
MGKTEEEKTEELMKRVAVNDAGSMYVLGNDYHNGSGGLLHDRDKAMELWKQAVELGSSKAHFSLGSIYHEGGDLKKEKLHYEAAAMAGHEMARNTFGTMEAQSGNMGQAVKHWTIAASAGEYNAMHNLLGALKRGVVSRELIHSTLSAYNNSCAEMRSEARDAFIQLSIVRNGAS